ncbi:unnamed protein product [Adineta steineri]|uniref:Uncharacterized protein n=1 Tax=Adineta steineri TaxID=433720 RepID=A0A818Z943_9BILA|nr:unnamed protein product [Adineta steineri]
MTSTQQKGLSRDRVSNSSDFNFTDLECALCHEVLWKPVACQLCETPFCHPCIHQQLKTDLKCPNGCNFYIERKCPPFISKVLSRLQISCFYKPNGCQQVLNYDALEKHEFECQYQLVPCSGCELNIMKTDLTAHQLTCKAIKVICKDCRLVYKRGEFSKKHPQNICLREQIRQLREESVENKSTIQMLTNQIHDLLSWKNRISQENIITFDDLPSMTEETIWIPPIYKGLKWSKMVYMTREYAAATYPTSGYMAALISGSNHHIAFFNEEASISRDGPNKIFSLISLTACAAWNDNLHLTIIGYKDLVKVKTYTSKLTFGKPQIVLLQWQNIDKIVFQPTGDTATHLENHELGDTHCIITQLVIDELV